MKSREEIDVHVPWQRLAYSLSLRGWATCEATGRRNQGNELEILCMYHFVAKQQLVKTHLSLVSSWYRWIIPT